MSARHIINLGVGISALAGCLGGCSAPTTSPGLTVPEGRYADAFDAARDVLRDQRFELDRVDARLGVLTTRVKPTDGMASPWDTEQTTLRQEWEDFANQQGRRVRIAFTPAGGKPGDLISYAGPVDIKVSVALVRTERPGWRPSTSSIRSSSFAIDPEQESQGLTPSYEVVAGEDDPLARRLAAKIRERLGLPRETQLGPVRDTKASPEPKPEPKRGQEGTRASSPADNR